MNKADAIRAGLRLRPMRLDQLHPYVEKRMRQVIGRQKLYQQLSVMQASREIDSAGRGDQRVYVLIESGKKK